MNKIELISEIDRKDLAVQMRKRVGDYSRVVDLLRTGGGESWTNTTDSQIRSRKNKLHFMGRRKLNNIDVFKYFLNVTILFIKRYVHVSVCYLFA